MVDVTGGSGHLWGDAGEDSSVFPFPLLFLISFLLTCSQVLAREVFPYLVVFPKYHSFLPSKRFLFLILKNYPCDLNHYLLHLTVELKVWKMLIFNCL